MLSRLFRIKPSLKAGLFSENNSYKREYYVAPSKDKEADASKSVQFPVELKLNMGNSNPALYLNLNIAVNLAAKAVSDINDAKQQIVFDVSNIYESDKDLASDAAKIAPQLATTSISMFNDSSKPSNVNEAQIGLNFNSKL